MLLPEKLEKSSKCCDCCPFSSMEQSHENRNWFSPIEFNGGKATPDPLFFSFL